MPDTTCLIASLATWTANHFQAEPVWLVLVAPPSSGKTEILNILYGLPDTHEISTFTEGALLSGTPRKKWEKGAKGGLLNEIGDFGIIVCKDFTTVLSMNRDTRAQALAALREIYDGRWTRRYGTDGGTAQSWTGKVGLIAAVTPKIDTHHMVISSMGERFLLCRLESDLDTQVQQARQALTSAGSEKRMREELRELVQALFEDIENDIELPHPTPALNDHLISLSTLVVRCRTTVERSGSGGGIDCIYPHESPPRLAKQLLSLFQGCIHIGCTEQESWDTVKKVGFDSIPPLRFKIISALHSNGEMTIEEIANHLKHPKSTINKRLEELSGLDVVQSSRYSGTSANSWRLTEVISDFIDSISLPLESTEGLFESEEHKSEMSVPPLSLQESKGILTFRESTETDRPDESEKVSA
jgi:DNA-binding MarR family transcriptional regulator